MSATTVSGSPQATPYDPRFDVLSAAMTERFRALTAAPKGARAHLFRTGTADLFTIYLEAFPPEQRQEHNCSACRNFLRRYGGLVRVDEGGKTRSVLWHPEAAPEPYTSSIRALAEAVSRAPIEGVFLAEEKVWGTPVTGPWHHFGITPSDACRFTPSAIQTAGQAAAEKREEYGMLLRGLEEFPLELVSQAHTLLTTGALYRSEKCIGVARWLLDVHEQRRDIKNERARENLLWLAVAAAPPGFCHVRSTMIGTLLEDLAAEMPFPQIKSRFDAKMHPLQYQRPTAEPSAGNLAQAEKIVEKLRSAGALERRFARLSDIQPLWTPRGPSANAQKGVFSHLKTKEKSSAAKVDVPPQVMTWEKFARTILPTAASIEYFVPATNAMYGALVTAKNPDAPPIIQWDFEERRNPVTWYVYVNGSAPARWNLKPNVYHPVTAITLQPSMWDPKRSFAHQGEKVVFLLEGAKDTQHTRSGGFFPEFLKSEYHAIRKTMEAYANNATIAGKDEAEACGLILQKGGSWKHSFRVTTKDGVRVVYELDRWD